jgi:hypothetical protein
MKIFSSMGKLGGGGGHYCSVAFGGGWRSARITSIAHGPKRTMNKGKFSENTFIQFQK